MSEVKRYWLKEDGGLFGCNPAWEPKDDEMVMWPDFKRVHDVCNALQRMLNQRDEQIETLKLQSWGDPVATPIDYGSLDAVQRLALCRGDMPVAAPVVPELTPELRWILGQMCFQHIHTAQALRLMGHQIARKAEDEQAVTIYWMLGHYLKDPANWRDNAAAEMKAAAPKA